MGPEARGVSQEGTGGYPASEAGEGGGIGDVLAPRCRQLDPAEGNAQRGHP